MEILDAGLLARPEEGLGLQQAVLEQVGAGERGPTVLLWRSPRYVAFTRPETRLEGFAEAARAARGFGFPVLVRNSGGGAVAANEGSLSFSLTFPVGNLRQGLYERYAEGVDLLVAALWRLGVAAEGGEVEGEFCPGAYSVRSGGELGVKHAGLAQRVTRRAARLEALVLAERTVELVPVLERVYAALGRPFRPGSVGDLPAGVLRVVGALKSELRERYGARETALDGGTRDRALEVSAAWRPAEDGARGS
ncbi:MAG: lipoate--protein ligase family protein [Rubrobacter sp.]|nr:lipoate--protein ligase family protein [Rubrobacter sp.]